MVNIIGGRLLSDICTECKERDAIYGDKCHVCKLTPCDRCGKPVPHYTLNMTITHRASGNLCMECSMYAFFGSPPEHVCKTTSTADYKTCKVCAKHMPDGDDPA